MDKNFHNLIPQLTMKKNAWHKNDNFSIQNVERNTHLLSVNNSIYVLLHYYHHISVLLAANSLITSISPIYTSTLAFKV